MEIVPISSDVEIVRDLPAGAVLQFHPDTPPDEDAPGTKSVRLEWWPVSLLGETESRTGYDIHATVAEADRYQIRVTWSAIATGKAGTLTINP